MLLSIKPAVWLTFEFSLVRQGEYSPLATRYPVRPFNGTATLEMELEAGEYIVYVKYDQWRTLNPEKDYEKWVMEKRTYPDVAKDVRSVCSKPLCNWVADAHHHHRLRTEWFPES